MKKQTKILIAIWSLCVVIIFLGIAHRIPFYVSLCAAISTVIIPLGWAYFVDNEDQPATE